MTKRHPLMNIPEKEVSLMCHSFHILLWEYLEKYPTKDKITWPLWKEILDEKKRIAGKIWGKTALEIVLASYQSECFACTCAKRRRCDDEYMLRIYGTEELITSDITTCSVCPLKWYNADGNQMKICSYGEYGTWMLNKALTSKVNIDWEYHKKVTSKMARIIARKEWTL